MNTTYSANNLNNDLFPTIFWVLTEDPEDTKAGLAFVKSWKDCEIAVDPEPSRLCINIQNNSNFSNISDKYRKKWKEKLEKMTRKLLVNQSEVNREVYKGEKAHDTIDMW